jgi:hypothetical protein
MAGYIHITRLSRRTGTDDRSHFEYQVNYVTAGVTYAVAFGEEELAHFLQSKVPLNEVQTAKVLSDLQNTGNANIGDVDIPENEASSIGMEQLPDDF